MKWRIFCAVVFVALFASVWYRTAPDHVGSVGDGILLGLLFAELFLRRRAPSLGTHPTGILLQGWTCGRRGCGAFNGTENKPERDSCRICGAPR